MDWYPGVNRRPLGALPPSEPKMTAHDIVCVHTMVGSLWGTDAYFHKEGWHGTESHLGTGYDGQLLQWMPFTHQADANLDGNYNCISIENADTGPGFATWSGRCGDVPAFTQAQIDRLVEVIDWLCLPASHAGCPSSWTCHQAGIPRVLISDTLPNRRGIGYHRQGIVPYLVPGGVKWSNSEGKCCPDNRRIDQLVNIIIPQVAELILPPELVPEEDEDMIMYVATGRSTMFLSGGRAAPLTDGADIDALAAKDIKRVTLATATYDKWNDRYYEDRVGPV